MKHLYSIFGESETDASAIVNSIGGDVDAQQWDVCCRTSVQYDAERGGWRIDLSVTETTQQAVGACWDTLVGAQIDFPRDVWLSTYSRATIARVTTPRMRVIAGVEGYILSAAELDALLSLPIEE
jgi:hypothetical protein